MRKRLITQPNHSVYASVEAFCAADSHPASVLTVRHGGLPIDIRFDSRGYDCTTVFFHAAITKAGMRFPVFQGAGISEELPTNRIFVSDPTLYAHDQLAIGWYAGSTFQPDLQLALTQILRALIPSNQRTVFFGASAGGFAALYYSHQFSDSVAVPVNPQTSIRAYNHQIVERWAKQAWQMPIDRYDEIPATKSVIPLYSSGANNAVWYVQNTGDTTHVDGQFKPFMEASDGKARISPLLVDSGQGHIPPTKEVLTKVLDAAVRADSPPALA